MTINSRNIMVGVISLTCVVAGILLALKNADGWGWFLFVALIVLNGLERETPCNCEDEEDEDENN